jgi:predicted DNA-binding protein YlxM (UPF0122 family)
MKKVHENTPKGSIKSKAKYRDRIDMLRSRMGLLKGKDKLLMTMYIENGNSFRQMARLVGVNEARIARKIHKVTERLITGEYITCLRNSDKLDKGEIDIAKHYFLDGLSIKKIAKRRRRTYYQVRETLKKIQEIVKVEDKGDKSEALNPTRLRKASPRREFETNPNLSTMLKTGHQNTNVQNVSCAGRMPATQRGRKGYGEL